MSNSSVINALQAALEASPDNRDLRLHLSRLLLDDDRAAEALECVDPLVLAHPDDVDVLQFASDAAGKAGRADQAEGYRKVIAALKKSSPVKEDGADEPVRLFAVARGTEDGGGDEIERPGITLKDVAGMPEVKRRLRTAFLAPLENPALRRMYGKSLRGGLLLYGPPGCGKTFIARATAGELGARFIAVGLHDVLDMYIGESERRLHEIFENARREAPCVLFFDEVDALGRRRTQVRNSASREVIVQFLAELDSFGAENEGVFVLAATNHPWDVDPALRRPGRFDRTLVVLPPDAEARERILALHLRDRPVKDIDLASIASRTDLFSGADLAHVCESAAEFAIEDSIESGRARPIGQPDMERSLTEVHASTVAWMHTARNFAEFANEGGMYDDLLRYLREHRIA